MWPFRSKPGKIDQPLTVDMHSHLLPGIDDGVDDMEMSLRLISNFQALGYKRLITTPHIYQEYYPNTPDTINEQLDNVREAIANEGIDMELFAGAEYYLDEHFVNMIESGTPLMSFGERNYVLFELSFLNQPMNLPEVVFALKSNGYQPILAHPERYMFVDKKMTLLYDLVDRGVLMQVNINSFTNFYSAGVRTMARRMVAAGLVHFVASDCHNDIYMESMQLAYQDKYFKKALSLPLLNNQLL